jgi:hypothetical protein
MENDVLTSDTSRELAINLDAHVLAAAGNECLGCEDVLDFTGSDTESEGTESTVCGSVTVTADDSRAGKSKTLLRADNVDNTLTLVAHTEVGEPKVLHVLLQGCALETRIILLDEVGGIFEVFS